MARRAGHRRSPDGPGRVTDAGPRLLTSHLAALEAPQKGLPMFRLLLAVLVYWALTSSGITPSDVLEVLDRYVEVSLR